MRFAAVLAFLAVALSTRPPAALAQGFGRPSHLAEIELERSHTCPGVLERLDSLNTAMAPLAERSRVIQTLGRAIALEDRSIVDSLTVDDPMVTRVREWFRTDASLAQRYVAQQSPTILAERNANRETIKAAVTKELQAVQSEANAAMEGNQELMASAASCDGAIFVRGAVQEACATSSGPLCQAVSRPASENTGFRFVDTPESVWDIEEIRPWTAPQPLRPGPGGQLDGGRTVGFTRVGNVVVSVAFNPLLAPRDRVQPDVVAAYEATNDSLGLTFQHPDLVFTPALSLRVALPEALDDEDGYILHFGGPEEADVLWTGEADTGHPLQATVPLTPSHVRRLTSGDQLMLTAIDRSGEVPDAVYAVAVGTVNQSPNARALLGYMSSRLSQDLARLVPPSSGG